MSLEPEQTNKEKATGTVLMAGATLRARKGTVFEIEFAKDFLEEAVLMLGLELRRFDCEKYGPSNRSFTLVGYLSESHVAYTTYPETKTVEFEVASCRTMDLGDFFGWLQDNKKFDIYSTFVLDKDQQGRWSRSV